MFFGNFKLGIYRTKITYFNATLLLSQKKNLKLNLHWIESGQKTTNNKNVKFVLFFFIKYVNVIVGSVLKKVFTFLLFEKGVLTGFKTLSFFQVALLWTLRAVLILNWLLPLLRT